MTSYEKAWVWMLVVFNAIILLAMFAAFERLEARISEVESRPPQTVVIEKTAVRMASEGVPRREAVPSEAEAQTPEPSMQSAEFTAYAYCACEKCCGAWSAFGRTASGTIPREGRTIAVDPEIIPLGTTVFIDGREYIAEDTGGGIHGNVIDVFHESHDAALNWGKRTVTVKWEE